MSLQIWAPLLAAAAVVASGPVAAEADLNLARRLVDAGDLSGAELEYWTVVARDYEDDAAWRKVVERETRRIEAERAAAAKRASDAAWANDPRHDEILRRQDAFLAQQEAQRRADQAAVDAAPTPAKAAARLQLVDGRTKTAQAVERWARVIVDSTGEVIENDPMDVAHARLEDLVRRQAELEARLKASSDPDELGAVIDELRVVEAQLSEVVGQIGGSVRRRRSTHRGTCHPAPVPDKPVAVFDCQYWASGVPRTITSGENIVLDRVMLDIDENDDDVPYRASVSYYWRYASNPPSDEPGSSYSGEIRHGANGALSLVFTDTDENGEERERSFPLTLTTGAATATFPGFGYGPMSFSFRRDPGAYVPWPDYAAAARGQAPDRRRGASEVYDMDIAPLTTPADPSSEDDSLAPLTAPPATPSSSPADPSSEDDWLAPLTVPSAAPSSSPSDPSSEDDWLAPLTQGNQPKPN